MLGLKLNHVSKRGHCKLWSATWRGMRIRVLCDNITSVKVLNPGAYRDEFLQECLRELLLSGSPIWVWNPGPAYCWGGQQSGWLVLQAAPFPSQSSCSYSPCLLLTLRHCSNGTGLVASLCVFMCSSSLDLWQPLILFKIVSARFALYTLDWDFPFLPAPLSAFY